LSWGGNAEFMAKGLADEKVQESGNEEEKETLVKKFLEQFNEQTESDRKIVLEQGGLHVLGTERHESRRIDNQLRGRQGRQGDPGSSRFYVSLEDDLMRLFASERIMTLMEKLGMEEGQVLEHPWLNKALENAQRRVEGHNFEIRKHLLEYDNVMNRQREVIYDLRRSVLESEDVKDLVLEAIEDVGASVVGQYLFSQGQGEEVAFDIDGLNVYLKAKFNFDLGAKKDQLKDMDQKQITDMLCQALVEKYNEKEKNIEPSHLRQLERMLLMHTIDSKWKDHLYAMDQLKEGVGMRAYAQRDPLVEFKREGFDMFQMMYDSVHQEVAEIIFKIQPMEAPVPMKGVFSSLPQETIHNEISGLADTAASRAAHMPPPSMTEAGADPQQQAPPKPTPIRKDGPKIGRNEPCP